MDSSDPGGRKTSQQFILEGKQALGGNAGADAAKKESGQPTWLEFQGILETALKETGEEHQLELEATIDRVKAECNFAAEKELADTEREHREVMAPMQLEIEKLTAALEFTIKKCTEEMESQRNAYKLNQARDRERQQDELQRLEDGYKKGLASQLEASNKSLAELKVEGEQNLQLTVERHRIRHDADLLASLTSKEKDCAALIETLNHAHNARLRDLEAKFEKRMRINTDKTRASKQATEFECNDAIESKDFELWYSSMRRFQVGRKFQIGHSSPKLGPGWGAHGDSPGKRSVPQLPSLPGSPNALSTTTGKMTLPSISQQDGQEHGEVSKLRTENEKLQAGMTVEAQRSQVALLQLTSAEGLQEKMMKALLETRKLAKVLTMALATKDTAAPIPPEITATCEQAVLDSWRELVDEQRKTKQAHNRARKMSVHHPLLEDLLAKVWETAAPGQEEEEDQEKPVDSGDSGGGAAAVAVGTVTDPATELPLQADGTADGTEPDVRSVVLLYAPSVRSDAMSLLSSLRSLFPQVHDLGPRLPTDTEMHHLKHKKLAEGEEQHLIPLSRDEISSIVRGCDALVCLCSVDALEDPAVVFALRCADWAHKRRILVANPSGSYGEATNGVPLRWPIDLEDLFYGERPLPFMKEHPESAKAIHTCLSAKCRGVASVPCTRAEALVCSGLAFQCFVSHQGAATAGGAIAKDVVGALSGGGNSGSYEVYSNLEPHQQSRLQLPQLQAIVRRCLVFVLCVSQRVFDSPRCMLELWSAIEAGLKVVLVRAADYNAAKPSRQIEKGNAIPMPAVDSLAKRGLLTMSQVMEMKAVVERSWGDAFVYDRSLNDGTNGGAVESADAGGSADGAIGGVSAASGQQALDLPGVCRQLRRVIGATLRAADVAHRRIPPQLTSLLRGELRFLDLRATELSTPDFCALVGGLSHYPSLTSLNVNEVVPPLDSNCAAGWANAIVETGSGACGSSSTAMGFHTLESMSLASNKLSYARILPGTPDNDESLAMGKLWEYDASGFRAMCAAISAQPLDLLLHLSLASNGLCSADDKCNGLGRRGSAGTMAAAVTAATAGCQGFVVLCAALGCGAIPNLQSLDLSNNNLHYGGNPEASIAFCAAVKKGGMKQLQTLNFSENNFDGDKNNRNSVPRRLAEMDEYQTPFSYVCDTLGASGDDGKMCMPALQSIVLTSNPLSKQGAISIAATLRQLPLLDSCILKHCSLCTPAPFVAIDESKRKTEKEKAKERAALVVAEAAAEEGAKGVENLCAALRENKIERLDLAGNSLGLHGARAFRAIVGATGFSPLATSITSLDLSFNDLKNTGAISVMEALCGGRTVPQLEYLSLKSNHIGPKAAAVVCAMVHGGGLPMLQTLDLSVNKVGQTTFVSEFQEWTAEGVQGIMELIEKSRHMQLKVLHIANNHIEKLALQQLQSMADVRGSSQFKLVCE
jgi:Leucine-rich repeat (LRR) protein